MSILAACSKSNISFAKQLCCSPQCRLPAHLSPHSMPYMPPTMKWLLFFALLLLVSHCLASESDDADGVSISTLFSTVSNYPATIPVSQIPRDLLEVVLSVQECSTLKTSTASVEVQLEQKTASSGAWAPLDTPWHVRCTHDLDNGPALRVWDLVSNPPSSATAQLRFIVSTTTINPIAFSFSLLQMYDIARYQVIVAAALLVLLYVLIVVEIMHRMVAALMGASIAIGAVWILRGRPPLDLVVSWIDVGAIGLLLGMMIIVGVLSTTGFFEYCAVYAFVLSKGHMRRLVVFLCIASIFLSAFLDNVTTMLLLAPVTLRLARVVDINPVPVLLAEVIFSNIGGTMTMIGDPPNIIIGNYFEKELSFLDFITNLTPVLFVCTLATFALVFLLFRKDLSGRHLPSDVLKNKDKAQVTWSPVDETSEDESADLLLGDEEVEANEALSLSALQKEFNIHNFPLFIKAIVVLCCVVIVFCLESLTGLEPAWVAMLGAVFLLLVATPEELDPFLEKVEWSTLLFFAGLFIFVECLAQLGLIRTIAELVIDVVGKVPEDYRVAVALIVVLWVSAIVSAFIDNVPWTATMVPIVAQLGRDTSLSLPLRPLIWALSLGACLGGNGTLVGASANIVAVGIAEQAGYPVTFRKFLQIGMPVMILTVSISTAYIWVVYALFGLDW